jgi:hypothetical protein
MTAYLSGGLLTVSIDLDHGASPMDTPARHGLEAAAAAVMKITARHNLPATWAADDASTIGPLSHALPVGKGHEIALSGDAHWVGAQVSKADFSRQLGDRVARARDAGVSVSTLALNGAQLVEHFDVAIRHGISAVRHPRPSGSTQARSLQPRTMQFGLWSFPTSIVLPGPSRWLPGGGGVRAARMAIEAAIRSGGLVQLVVDCPLLAARGPSAERIVDHVLRYVDRRRSEGKLEVMSIASAVARLTLQHQGRPSRSILRPAA